MQVSSVSTSTLSTLLDSKVSSPSDVAPPSGGKIGFSAEKTSGDGKIGFIPPSDGKIGGTVDVKA